MASSTKGAAACKADFWGKWVNAFVRVIPADRHIGAMGKIRRGGRWLAVETGSEQGPAWGGRKGLNFCLDLGGIRWKPTLQPRLVALPEGYTLSSEQGCLFFW